MSIEQLWALREQISAILTSKMSFKKVQLEELLRKLNHSVEPRKGTLKGDRERRPYPPVVPKYRNPGRPSETWAGRGRRPRWLIAQLASGKQLDDFRIESTAMKSLSADPEIRKLDGLLHKIGFTAGKMEVRIQNAKDDPTFLMAGVHPVATYTLYNIDRVKLENLLHTFFAESRLNIEITDRFGRKIKPREWFLVPPALIAEAVSRLKDGSIVNFQYDAGRAAIIPIDSQ